MARNSINEVKNIARPVTMKDLGEFAEQVVLPGVEEIVEKTFDEKFKENIEPLRNDIKEGFNDVSKSIRVLAGEIIELKEDQKDENYNVENRLLRLEKKVEIHG